MPPARDANNRDLAGGRTTGLAADAELRKVHASSGSRRPSARASLEPEKLHFNRNWGDFLQAESAVLPKDIKLCPSKGILSPLCGAGGCFGGVPELAGGKAGPMESNPGWALGVKANSEHRRWRSRPGKGFAKLSTYVRAREETTRNLSETAWRGPS